MVMSCFLVSKVLVGELLEHKVTKRALFVGVHANEPAYFALYSFTMIGLLTDILFEAFADRIIAESPEEPEQDLRQRLFTSLLPPGVGLKRGFGYSQVCYDQKDPRKKEEWQKLSDFMKQVLMSLQLRTYQSD